tara:strand:+ start:1858 stop:2058 length:201 start_codon:yes stop_codon:yes gene_type:complete
VQFQKNKIVFQKGQLVHTSFMGCESIGVYLGFITVNDYVLHRVYNLKKKIVTFYTSDELKPIGSKK